MQHATSNIHHCFYTKTGPCLHACACELLALSKADVVTGPYDFTKYPDLPAGGENPAFIVYEKVAGGPTSYTFWMGGKVREVCM